MVVLLLWNYFRGLCAFVGFRHWQKCILRFAMKRFHVWLTSGLSVEGAAKKDLFWKWGRRTKKFEKSWQTGLKHYILYFVENDNFKTEINTPCVHWMYCACLVRKICGYYYYKKGVYVQVIRSTARRYFRGRQHGPSWKCVDLHPKNKPTKNARNHGNLRRELFKYTKEL